MNFTPTELRAAAAAARSDAAAWLEPAPWLAGLRYRDSAALDRLAGMTPSQLAEHLAATLYKQRDAPSLAGPPCAPLIGP